MKPRAPDCRRILYQLSHQGSLEAENKRVKSPGFPKTECLILNVAHHQAPKGEAGPVGWGRGAAHFPSYQSPLGRMLTRKVPLQRPTLVPLPHGGAWTRTRELRSGLNPAILVSQP